MKDRMHELLQSSLLMGDISTHNFNKITEQIELVETTKSNIIQRLITNAVQRHAIVKKKLRELLNQSSKKINTRNFIKIKNLIGNKNTIEMLIKEAAEKHMMSRRRPLNTRPVSFEILF
jgi:hypothetical protein